MAAASKRGKRRNKGSGGGLPGWAMLTIGLVIGLFVAFLVYLDDIDPMSGEEVAIDTDGELPDAGESDRPRFEFYSILPELEVVIPELPRRDAAPEPEEGITPPTEGIEPAPEVDDAGRFYLQVGSFQEERQAESMKAEVTLLGLDVEIRSVRVNGDRWHRVRVGPFADTDNLRTAQDRLRDNGIDYLVLRDRG